MPKKKTSKTKPAQESLVLDILTSKPVKVKAEDIDTDTLAKEIVAAVTETEKQNESIILREHLANSLLGFVTEVMFGDGAKCHAFLDALGQAVATSDLPDPEWWQAHIHLIKAIRDQSQDMNEYDQHKVWKQALERGRSAKNAIVMYTAVSTITFGFSHYTKGFGELAGMQKELLEVLDSREPDPDTLSSFGQDLYEFWSKADYKRISVRDLSIKRNLMEGAQTLKAKKTPKAGIPGMMILLLGASYGYQGKSTQWAVEEVNKAKVPDEVKEMVGEYLG